MIFLFTNLHIRTELQLCPHFTYITHYIEIQPNLERDLSADANPLMLLKFTHEDGVATVFSIYLKTQDYSLTLIQVIFNSSIKSSKILRLLIHFYR